jgi:hypothetical protein
VLTSGLLAVTGLKKQPGIGVIASDGDRLLRRKIWGTDASDG